MITEDFYYILGVEKTASMADIKSAYRKLARKYHPDVRPGHHNRENFSKILRAYKTLSDPVKREAYDTGRSNALTDDPRKVLTGIWREIHKMGCDSAAE